MKKELQQKLIDEFSSYFRDIWGDPRKTCMAYGCAVGDGWFDLLWNLCESIRKADPNNETDFKFAQIKEKFGGLRAYHYGGNEEMKSAVDLAEEESYKICEECGTTENITTEGQWVLTLCRTCRESEK